MKNNSKKTKQKEYKYISLQEVEEKGGKNFMRRVDRQWLYALVGFFGGLIVTNMILTQNTPYRTIFTIIGGLLVGFIGYLIATR